MRAAGKEGRSNDERIRLCTGIMHSYSDYFGDLAIGKPAINQNKTAWKTEPMMFEVKKRIG